MGYPDYYRYSSGSLYLPQQVMVAETNKKQCVESVDHDDQKVKVTRCSVLSNPRNFQTKYKHYVLLNSSVR